GKDIPVVGVLRGQSQRARSVGFRAYHDRRSRGPRATAQQLAVSRLVILAFEVDRSLAQQRMNDLKRLLEPRNEVVEWIAKGVEFRLYPTCAESEDQPAVADLVHSIGHLGEQRRIAKARASHEGAELYVIGGRGERRKNRPAFPDGQPRSPRDDGMRQQCMVGYPERIEADSFC